MSADDRRAGSGRRTRRRAPDWQPRVVGVKPRVLALAIVCLAAVLAAGGAATPAAAQASGNASFVDVNASDLPGDGMESNPYEISNASELQAINDSLDAHYELVGDVNASGTADWNDGDGFEPIAPDVDPSTLDFDGTRFTGSFDGRNHTISGLTIDRSSESNVGLFGATGESAVLRNVSLTGVEVHGDYTIGTFVAQNNGSIEDVLTAGTVTVAGNQQDGGGNTLGGLVGENGAGGTIDATASTVDVHGVGGPAGSTSVGGLIGANQGAVTNSYATGSASGASSVGGLVGWNNGSVKNTFATTNLSADISSGGGLVGLNEGDSGGGTGYYTSTVTNSFWNVQTSGVSDPIGDDEGTTNNVHGLTTAEMTGVTAAPNMTGLDFQSNWTVTAGYPERSSDPAAPFATSIVDTNSPVTAGKILTVDVRVENVAGFAAQDDLELLAPDGSVVVTEDETLFGGDDTTVTLNWQTQSGDSGGAIEIASPGENPVQSVTVGQSGPNFQTTITDVNGTVSTGETVVVDYEVENVGTAGGEQTIDLHVDDAPADEATGVTLADGESTNRTFVYEPSAGDAPVIDLTVQSYDDLAQETVTVNRPPVPSDDGYTVTEGEALAVGESDGVLANDTDPDGDALTAAAADLPEHGTLALAANGSFEYTPGPDFVGTDSFTYELSDGTTTADETGTVTITVEEPQSGDGPAGMFGSGTETDPYLITNVTQLQAMNQELGANYTLGNDVDASDTATWNSDAGFDPVGTDATPFTGTFDGQGHAVSNLTVDRPGTNATGLIGALGEDGTATTVTLVGATIAGDERVGALVGNNTGGTVSAASASGSVSGSDDVGGLVGRNAGLVVESDAAVSVASDGGGVGGLVGGNIGGTVSESFATGDVGSADASSVGGLVGLSTAGTINESYATGNVTGDAYVGGLVGDVRTDAGTDSVVERSYATGRVDGNTNVGGVVGGMVGTYLGATATLADSYWDERGTNRTDAVGNAPFATTIENNTGYNTSDGQGRAAELIGGDAAGNMAALDFGTTWTTVPGEYPALAWQDAGTGDDDPDQDPTPDPAPDPDPGEANDPPNAADDDYVVYENGTLSVTAENGTLANDTDPDDNDDLSAAVERGPANGTLNLAANGSFVYEPEAGFTGNDSFTYEVSDGDGGTDSAPVSITVTSPPNASMEIPATTTVGEEITLDASDAETPYGDIVEYEWSVGDRDLSGETATLTLDETGEHTAELTVTNDAGRTATVTETIVVETAEDDASQSDDPTETSSDGDDQGLWMAVPIVALVLGLVAVRLRE